MKSSVINAMSCNIGNEITQFLNIAENSSVSTVLTDMEAEDSKLNSFLNGENIDIAGLQGCAVEPKWSRLLKEKLDEKYSLLDAHTRDTRNGLYIVYLKSKFEVIDDGIFWLYEGAPLRAQKFETSEAQRICIWALVRVRDTGEVFVFMNTKLDTNAEVRPKQASVIMSQISIIRDNIKNKLGIVGCPVILVGDMNCCDEATEYGIITAELSDALYVFKRATEESPLASFTNLEYCKTAEAIKTRQRIDSMFVSEKNISVLNYKMVQTDTNISPYGEYSSNRNAVIAQLELSVEVRADKYAKRYYEDSLDIPRFETKGYYSWNIFEGGSGLYSIEKDAELHVREFCVNEVSWGEIEAYVEALKSNGFAVDGQTVGEYVSFTSFCNGKKRVVLSYEEQRGVARIVIDPSGITPEMFSYSVEAKENESAEIYQYGLEQLHKYTENGAASGFYSANGMSYVIKCADNSLIIIDGGQRTQMIGENGDYAPAEQYNAFLHEITGIPYDEKIRISCWYLTHAHDDHDQGFCEFIRRFYSQYELEIVCANTPAVSDPIWGLADLKLLKQDLAEFIKKEYPNCKFYIPHAGDIFQLADVKMRVMLTLEELVDPVTGKTAVVFRDDPSAFNDTSTVIKLWLGGMTVLITGDVANLGGSRITELYRESLKSDIIQAAHHGGNLIPELYEEAKAKYVFVPTNHKNTLYKKYFQVRYLVFAKYSDAEYYSGTYDMTVGLAYRNGKIVEVHSPKIRTTKNFFV